MRSASTPAVSRWRGIPRPLASGFSVNVTGREADVGRRRRDCLPTRPAEGRRQLKWYDRLGNPVGTVGEALTGLTGGRLSPDGRTVASLETFTASEDIWLMETARGTLTRLTSDSASRPAWSPDGTRIAFSSVQDGFVRLYCADDWSERARRALVSHRPKRRTCATGQRTGSTSSFRARVRRPGATCGSFPLTAANTSPFRSVSRQPHELIGSFSPDGKWVAYVSDETGRSNLRQGLPRRRAGVARVDQRDSGDCSCRIGGGTAKNSITLRQATG